MPRTVSRQKFPRPSVLFRVNPRIIAISTLIPTAADRKLLNVNPIIWVR